MPGVQRVDGCRGNCRSPPQPHVRTVPSCPAQGRRVRKSRLSELLAVSSTPSFLAETARRSSRRRGAPTGSPDFRTSPVKRPSDRDVPDARVQKPNIALSGLHDVGAVLAIRDM